MTEEVVAVIGAGVMGRDIALDLSSCKYNVILKDLTEDILQQALHNMRTSYRFFKLMKKDTFSVSVDELLSRITLVTDYEGFDEVGIVIENIT